MMEFTVALHKCNTSPMIDTACVTILHYYANGRTRQKMYKTTSLDIQTKCMNMDERNSHVA